MKKIMKKYYKLIIAFLVVIVIVLLGVFIYKNLFQEGVSERLDGIENYKLTKQEKTEVKEKLNEIEEVNSINIDTNYKIIKIFLELNKNVDFEIVKKVSNEAVEKFSSDNLSFYDIEIFVDCVECVDEEDNVYPKIGYKYKTNSEFTWNR